METAKVEMPALLLQHEAEHMVEEQERMVSQANMNMDDYLVSLGKTREEFVEESKTEASDRLKRSFVLAKIAEEEFPDINANPEQYGVVSWDMQPGDCIAFNGRTMHGGSGKLDNDRDLRVFTTKWLGDDARIKFRNYGMDPDFSSLMIDKGLKSGDCPDTDLYPRVWTRG